MCEAAIPKPSLGTADRSGRRGGWSGKKQWHSLRENLAAAGGAGRRCAAGSASEQAGLCPSGRAPARVGLGWALFSWRDSSPRRQFTRRLCASPQSWRGCALSQAVADAQWATSYCGLSSGEEAREKTLPALKARCGPGGPGTAHVAVGDLPMPYVAAARALPDRARSRRSWRQCVSQPRRRPAIPGAGRRANGQAARRPGAIGGRPAQPGRLEAKLWALFFRRAPALRSTQWGSSECAVS